MRHYLINYSFKRVFLAYYADNKFNQNVNKILNNVILKSDNLQNKIYFKNLLNDAIKSYDG